MPQGEGTYGKQVGRPPAKDYSPYKMKGSPMYRNFGVGTTPKGVSGESPVSGKSPAKGWLKKMAKKVGGFAKKAIGMTPIGMAAKAFGGKGGGGGGELEARVAALEAGGGGGEGAAAEPVAAGAEGADPAAAAAAEGGDPAAAGQAAKKAQMAGMASQSTNAANTMMGMSDIRLKEKIQKTGVSPSGIPIYEFNYIGGNSRYSGAMAQDLLSMGIDAVSVHESGYYQVNYNNIDVDMHQIN